MASSRLNVGEGAGDESPSALVVPDEDHGVDLPMSMMASVILTNLPRDATQALADVEALDDKKGQWEVSRRRY